MTLANIVLHRASRAEAGRIGQLISDAFWDLAASKWIIRDPVEAQRIFPEYFARVVTEVMRAHAVVECTPARDAVAVWLPVLPDDQDPGSPDDWNAVLDEVCGPYAERFRVFEGLQQKHHPHRAPHHYLALCAVRPGRQRQGVGRSMIESHHVQLDLEGVPSYLEAAGPRQREFYLRTGYQDLDGPYHLPDGGPPMFPMWREPQPVG